MKKTEIIAHRGFSSEWAENSLSAIQAAIKAGADMIELDVHLTDDRHLVVIHDETVDRTTNGTGQVNEMTLKQIQNLNLLDLEEVNSKNPQLLNETVPTLDEVIELIQEENSDIQLNIELKTDVNRYPGIEEKLVEGVERHHFGDRVLVSSFNHDSLRKLYDVCQRELPEGRKPYKLGALFERGVNPLEQKFDIPIASYHPHHKMVTSEMVKACQEKGSTIRTWTVDEKDRMIELIDMGVGGIITNCPDRLKKELTRSQPPKTLSNAPFSPPYDSIIRPPAKGRDHQM